MMFSSPCNITTCFGGIIGTKGLGLGLSKLEKLRILWSCAMRDSGIRLFFLGNGENSSDGIAPPTMVVANIRVRV